MSEKERFLAELAESAQDCTYCGHALDRIEVLTRENGEKGYQVFDLMCKFNDSQKRIKELEDTLRECAAELLGWGAYASEYFQEKYDLQGDFDRFTAIAGGKAELGEENK